VSATTGSRLREATDPFTLAIVRGALLALSDEMFVALQRTSKSPIIYETLDYAVGIADSHGRLLTQGNGVAGFLGTLDGGVRAVLAKHASDICRGDVFITNDPYGGGGTHLSDVSLIMPIFYDDALVAFVANKAHWTEVGGKDPGSWTTDATEIYQEGLQFPTVKLFSRGQPDQAILDLIAANVRLPDMTLGDLWAGIAALRVGERRFLELCQKYSHVAVHQAIDDLLDYGEQMIRLELAKLPKGTFHAEDHIDDDGIGNGPFHVQVDVTITDDRFTVDYTGSHPQVPGPINGTRAGLVSSARAAFLGVVGAAVPRNAGAFRPLHIVCPDGTLFTAQSPAPVSTYWETLEYATDLIWKALAPHIPERLPAGHFLSVCGTILSGLHPDSGESFLLVEPLVGGWGAGATKDGQNGQFCVGDGETYNIPVEITETRYGVLVDQYAFHNEDGGAGRYRGGKGVVLDYAILGEEAWLTSTMGRHHFPPWSLDGAQPGSANRIEIHRPGHAPAITGKVTRFRLRRGDTVRLVTGSGGGCGDPRQRDRARVRADLKNGFITAEQARQHYDPAREDSLAAERGEE